MAHSEQSDPHGRLEERARFGFELVETEPEVAERVLRDVLSAHDRALAPAAVVLAHRGLGRLLTNRGEMLQAEEVFEQGLRVADQAGLPSEAARVRVNWAVARQASGHLDSALDLLSTAEPFLAGGDLGLLISQRGYLFWMQGEPRSALDAYDRALPMLRDAGELHGLIRVLGNRGVACAQMGLWQQARDDFESQLALATEHARGNLVAAALHNSGWLEGRLGNLPLAMALLSSARDAYVAVGAPGRSLTSLDTDHCEVLLQAMLAPEADEIATRVVAESERSGNAVQVAEARLMRARSLLLMQRHDQSIAEGTAARAMFIETDRDAWAARADYFIEQALVSMPSSGRTFGLAEAERVAAIADALGRNGWFLEAIEVRVHAGRMALAAGYTDVGRDQLSLAADARSTGVAAVRAEAWHATALLRLADGDTRAARRAIDAGLRALDRHRATLGAIELRAHASAHGVELGRLGLRLALAGGTATDVLTWAERWRAGALALPAAPVIADSELTSLRQLHAVGAGPDGDVDESLPARIAEAERSITARARFASGDPGSVGSRIDAAGLRRSLLRRTLVEFVELDNELHAVVVTRRRSRLVQLGATSRVMEAHDHLVFALRRLSMLPPDHPALDGAAAALNTAAAEIDALLLDPLRLDPGDIVIVPTGGLHRMAWSTFPSLRQRAVTVTPSAAWWLAGTARRQPIDHDRVLLVEGPDLEGTAAELAAIRDLVPDAICLFGTDATADRVLAELATADVAHIAAHGSFRGDNPLFSTLRVADGPIWVHDLAGLATTPRLVILTACEAGRSGVLAGDELLGTATALLSLGVETVIAPLLPVPDIATARFAIRLHHHLAAGLSPAHARAATALDERASGDPSGLAVASTFQCIGNRFSDMPRIS
jgi:hypothetical protein